MSSYLRIAIDTPLRRLFDYHPPAHLPADIFVPGQRLWVPFGKRRTVGVLAGISPHSDLPAHKLRRALDLIDETAAIPADLLELLLWSAEYYRHPVGEVVAAALPAALRQGAPLTQTESRWTLTELDKEQALARLPPRARRMRTLLEIVAGGGTEGVDARTLDATGEWRSALRTLVARGLVRHRKIAPDPAPSSAGSSAVGHGPNLSPAQRTAIARIEQHLGSFGTLLLDGVTGSGKTEAYLRSIETVLARGQQALVLVPEISLTPQLTQRFAQRFAAPMAVLHSSLSDGERLEAWRLARNGVASIVIGTRSAVFAPLARPGLIIVDEEHDASYKQQEGFRYSARDLAIARAQRLGIPVVLGSATPSLESLARLHHPDRKTHSEHLLLPQRAGNAQPPALQVIDLRRHAATQGLSTPALLAIRRHLDAGGQVLLYLNRRGYAPALFCPGCGWTASCRRCDARLTVHRRDEKLVCHHCAAEQSVPALCPSCGESPKPVGQGTERIEETLAALFPSVLQARIDRDSIRRKGDLEAAMERIRSGEARLLIGTQMLAKGHHFPDVGLVIVVNADQGLFGTDFRASERLAQTIVQVAGRAGRAARPGEVLIQTEYPQHPLLQQLLVGGYPGFAAAALLEREQALWPPYSRLALVRAEATTTEAPFHFLAAARNLASGPVTLLGPAPAPMQRRDGRFRAHLLLQARTPPPLQQLLTRWIPRLEALPEARKVRWSVDVDPLELY